MQGTDNWNNKLCILAITPNTFKTNKIYWLLYSKDADTGKYQRTWGGVGLWCTAIVKDWWNNV